MVPLPLIRSTNTAVAHAQSLIAVFVGSTSGIGEFSVRALAKAHGTQGKGLRIYIVGRNAAAAEKIFEGCREVCPKGQFVFVPGGDIALLKNVDKVSVEILRLESERGKEESGKEGGLGKARIDLLVMCQGVVYFDGRKETTEGLDTLMSLWYYSRVRLTTQLLPLLLASNLPTGSRVVSVLGPGNEKAGRENKVYPDDLSLRDPKHYGFIALGDQLAYMKTFFFEYLAKKYPGKISLIHYFPGLVFTDAFGDPKLPLWFKTAFTVLKPLLSLSSRTIGREETGERLLFLASSRFPAREVSGDVKAGKGDEIGVATASDGVVGGGAYRIIYTGEVIPTVEAYTKHRKDGLPEKCVEHTLKAFEVIEAGKVFKD